eukprot:6886401-Prymnesium_polylepis.2
MYKTVLTVTLSGDVSSFDEATKRQMKALFVDEVGVSPDQVELTITAASVKASFTTFSSSGDTMRAVETAVEASLGNRTQVASMLSTVNLVVAGGPEIGTVDESGTGTG